MNIDRSLRSIPDPARREELKNFIATGEGTEGFLDVLDSSPEHQALVESAFREQAEELEAFARQLQSTRSSASGAPAGKR